ncbi:Fur family transcriptional regulator [Plantibacter sp. Mn2098]|uniref:Fur family transcriptional regulator n=1 Tax=Plantibacter sp. Mn2098 TaxID=3395266 RepID=UPI003BC0F9B5
MAKRNTWQREAVREALGGNDGFISAQGLHAELHATGSPIGLATVYRALADLSVEGEADSLQSPEGESLYRACTPGKHHHHLICRNCGLTIEIEADEVEAWARRVASQQGFTQAQHVVDIFGLCADCSAAAAASDQAGALTADDAHAHAAPARPSTHPAQQQ